MISLPQINGAFSNMLAKYGPRVESIDSELLALGGSSDDDGHSEENYPRILEGYKPQELEFSQWFIKESQ